MIETIKSTEVFSKRRFRVLVYCADDLYNKKIRRQASLYSFSRHPMGSGLGICNRINISLDVNEQKVPVIIDAGIGAASNPNYSNEIDVCDGY